MDGEILVVQKDIAGSEDQTLVLMEQIDGASKDVKAREADLKEEEELVKKDVGAMEKRATALATELAGFTKEREEAIRDVDTEWLRVYDRIFKNRKDKALVSVENGVCGGCHMKLPPYQAHAARRRNAIVQCEYCGRMLY